MRRDGGRRSGGGSPASAARTDANNTFTGEQTFADLVATGSALLGAAGDPGAEARVDIRGLGAQNALRAQAGATATHIAEFYTSAGTLAAYIGSAGDWTSTGAGVNAAQGVFGAAYNIAQLIARGVAGQSVNLLEAQTSASAVLAAIDSAGNYVANAVGAGVKIKEGANARMGVATMSLGVVTVANTLVTATSRIFLTGQTSGGGAATWGDIAVSARSAGVSFTIASSSSTDSRQVAWEIKEPA